MKKKEDIESKNKELKKSGVFKVKKNNVKNL